MTSQPKSEDRIRCLPADKDQIRGKSHYTPVRRESDDRKLRSKVRDVYYSVISRHTCLQTVITSKSLLSVGNILRVIAYVLTVGTNFIKLGIVKNKGTRSVRKGQHTSLHDDSYSVRVTYTSHGGGGGGGGRLPLQLIEKFIGLCLIQLLVGIIFLERLQRLKKKTSRVGDKVIGHNSR